MTIAANLVDAHVQSFCDEVVLGSSPVTVPCKPLPAAKALDCFLTVDQHVQALGGRSVLGWAIWEFPGVLIEAEFHAVWERPADGALIDIAQRQLPFTSITFLPDPQRMYGGRQVDNVRKPLNKDPKVRQLIHLKGLHFEMLNAGARAQQYEIALSGKERKVYGARQKQIERLQLSLFR